MLGSILYRIAFISLSLLKLLLMMNLYNCCDSIPGLIFLSLVPVCEQWKVHQTHWSGWDRVWIISICIWVATFAIVLLRNCKIFHVFLFHSFLRKLLMFLKHTLHMVKAVGVVFCLFVFVFAKLSFVKLSCLSNTIWFIHSNVSLLLWSVSVATFPFCLLLHML